MTAAGIPVVLFQGGDSTGLREAWRQFLHGTIQPVSLLVNAELTAKLEKDVSLNFDRAVRKRPERARAGVSVNGGRRHGR